MAVAGTAEVHADDGVTLARIHSKGEIAPIKRLSVACVTTQVSGGKKSTSKAAKALPKPAIAEEGSADDPQEPSAAAEATATVVDPKGKKDKQGRSKGDSLYYRVKCKDNGVGMPHDKVGRPETYCLRRIEAITKISWMGREMWDPAFTPVAVH